MFLQQYSDAGQKIYESHPEVCFAKLTGDSLAPKDTQSGQKERLAVLDDDRELQETINEIVTEHQDGAQWHERISKGKIDDVIDAAVLAYVAKHLELDTREESHPYPRLPETPDGDPKLDHPMEIVYFEP